jgi:hypothetical protein
MLPIAIYKIENAAPERMSPHGAFRTSASKLTVSAHRGSADIPHA